MTMESLRGVVDCMVVLDTGSSDNSVAVVREWCAQHKVPLYLMESTFVDFSYSRNELVEFAERHCDFQLHMDVNDVLVGGQRLRDFVHAWNGPESTFMVFQQWFLGDRSIRFRNLRLCRSGRGYRYKYRVHEMLTKPGQDMKDVFVIDTQFDETQPDSKDCLPPLKGFLVFQDRTLDNTKSHLRYTRDADILYRDWLSDPSETRTLFYLGQTYEHLLDRQRAYMFYQKRVDRAQQGYKEESLHAMVRMGSLAEQMEMPSEVVEQHYWDAVNFSMREFYGIILLEPVLRLVRIHDSRQEFAKAFALLKMVIDEPYPVIMNLFIDKTGYNLHRHHWMGRVCAYVGQLLLGAWHAILAWRVARDVVDKKNVECYLRACVTQQQWASSPEAVDSLLSECRSIQELENWMRHGPGWRRPDAGPAQEAVAPPNRAQRRQEMLRQKRQLRKKA